ncbi:MAG: Deoxyguanosinetriphosphate triphosphohydrolase [Chroococcopsis gigantea SAG 12.99]|jgi:dGTPase|nr:Deoxyguanosinetriphosphate triphosphohydrolase [Chroococcopsis gigantea SAG 12.99]
MEWTQLLTPQRLGKTHIENRDMERTPFLKDYDRLVYSVPFRRLKDKTQVFPLVKTEDIRTRLGHSLEVSCVGRSLGRIVGEQIIQRHRLREYSGADFGDILSAACLAHDIGNPPFGHAGEDAIRQGFNDWYAGFHPPDGGGYLSSGEKTDLALFEGNAQGFRILARLENGGRPGGMQLTCPCLAAFAKYPRESEIGQDIIGHYQGRSVQKYGFFQGEKDLFAVVAETVGLIRRHPDAAWWARHPLAFLLEAADDICYSIVDIEDGFRMGYVSYAKAKELLGTIAGVKIDGTTKEETIKRLRAKAINRLVGEIAEIFLDLESEILAARFDHALIGYSSHKEVFKTIESVTKSSVFLHPNVVRIKIAGYEILGGLFNDFANALFSDGKKAQLLICMLSPQYRPLPGDSSYDRLLKLTDYISSLTDFQATRLFQQLRGICL